MNKLGITGKTRKGPISGWKDQEFNDSHKENT